MNRARTHYRIKKKKMEDLKRTDEFLERMLSQWKNKAHNYFGMGYPEIASKMFKQILFPEPYSDYRGPEYDWYAVESSNNRLKGFSHIVADCDGRFDPFRTGMIVNIAMNKCLHVDIEVLLDCGVDDVRCEGSGKLYKGCSSDFFGVIPLFEHLCDVIMGLTDEELDPENSISFKVLLAMSDTKKRDRSPEIQVSCPYSNYSPTSPVYQPSPPSPPAVVNIFPVEKPHRHASKIRGHATKLARRCKKSINARNNREANTKKVLDTVVPLGDDQHQYNTHASLCALLGDVNSGINQEDLQEKLDGHVYSGCT